MGKDVGRLYAKMFSVADGYMRGGARGGREGTQNPCDRLRAVATEDTGTLNGLYLNQNMYICHLNLKFSAHSSKTPVQIPPSVHFMLHTLMSARKDILFL